MEENFPPTDTEIITDMFESQDVTVSTLLADSLLFSILMLREAQVISQNKMIV